MSKFLTCKRLISLHSMSKIFAQVFYILIKYCLHGSGMKWNPKIQKKKNIYIYIYIYIYIFTEIRLNNNKLIYSLLAVYKN